MKKYYKVNFNGGDGRSFIVTDKRPSYKTCLDAKVLIQYDKGVRRLKVKTPLIRFSVEDIERELSEDEYLLELL